MNGASVKALVALIPMSVFFAGSVVISLRRKCISSFLQLFGATGLLGVVLIHVCEALGVVPGMSWGIKGQHRPLSRFAVRYRRFHPVSGWVFDARGEDVCRRER